MGEVRQVLTDAVRVVAHGLRLVVAHAPVLAVLYLLGAAGRHGVLWLAVEASAVHPTLGGMLLPFAPMSSVVAFVLMLVVVARSADLSATPQAAAGTTGGARWLPVLASVMVPFLTVYAAQGYLDEDLFVFTNAAVHDELRGDMGVFYGEVADLDRAAVATGWVLVALVLVSLVLRFLFDRFRLPSRHRPLAFVAAYVEVLWILILGAAFAGALDRVWDWVQDRVFVRWVQDRWADLIDLLGPVGDPVARLVQAVGTFIDNADDVVLVPIAWLTVAAVVFGRSIALPERPPRRPGRRTAALRARTPHVVRRWAGEVTEDFASRFEGLRRGVRILLLGGIVPMAMFCLVFVVCRQAGVGVRELWRLVLGPQEADTMVAFVPWLALSADLVEYVLLAGLLAAAVHQVQVRQERLALRTADESTPEASETRSTGSST